MSEVERAAYVAAARSWIGTPFHDNASVKGVGVDCAQLVRAAALETGLREIEPTGEYSPQFMLHRDAEILVTFIKRYAVEIEADRAREGDLVVYKIGRVFAHVAILTGPGTIIHAHKQTGMVCEAKIDGYDLAGRERRYFSPWG